MAAPTTIGRLFENYTKELLAIYERGLKEQMAKKEKPVSREIVDDLDKMMEKLELPKRVILAEILDAEDVKLPEKKDKKK